MNLVVYLAKEPVAWLLLAGLVVIAYFFRRRYSVFRDFGDVQHKIDAAKTVAELRSLLPAAYWADKHYNAVAWSKLRNEELCSYQACMKIRFLDASAPHPSGAGKDEASRQQSSGDCVSV